MTPSSFINFFKLSLGISSSSTLRAVALGSLEYEYEALRSNSSPARWSKITIPTPSLKILHPYFLNKVAPKNLSKKTKIPNHPHRQSDLQMPGGRVKEKFLLPNPLPFILLNLMHQVFPSSLPWVVPCAWALRMRSENRDPSLHPIHPNLRLIRHPDQLFTGSAHFSKTSFMSGLRFPISSMYTDMAHYFGVTVNQLNFISFWLMTSTYVPFRMNIFLINLLIIHYFYACRFNESFFSIKARIRTSFFFDIISSFKGWKSLFFFIQLPCPLPCSTNFITALLKNLSSLGTINF